MSQHSQSLASPGMVNIGNTRGPMMPGMVSNLMAGNSGYNPHGQGINYIFLWWFIPPILPFLL